MEHILQGAITSQMKHVTGKSQHGFTKGKSCLTDMITLYDEIVWSMWAEWCTFVTWISPRLLIWLPKALSWGSQCVKDLDEWSLW